MGEVADAPLYIDDSPNMDDDGDPGQGPAPQAAQRLKLVVIDYLQLMTSGKRVESRQQEVLGVLPCAEAAGQGARGPVIAMSQLNRGSEQRQDKKPMLSDLRESGSIEQRRQWS